MNVSARKQRHSKPPSIAHRVAFRALLAIGVYVTLTLCVPGRPSLPPVLAATDDSPDHEARQQTNPLRTAPHAGQQLIAHAVKNASADQDCTTQLARLEDAFADVVDRVRPSVVALRIYRRDYTDADRRDIVVNGSGAIIDANGLILTNEHVVRGAERVLVRFAQGDARSAEIVAVDPRSDLAIVRPLDAAPHPPVTFGDDDALHPGQWTLALGNPYGIGGDGLASVSVGVIANLHRSLPELGRQDDRLYADMIQTTAVVQPGNSGGPLFDLDGRMIGLITAVYTRAAADEGVGFAIPLSTRTLRIVQQLAAGQRITYSQIGLAVHDAPDGVIISDVANPGPAASAGLLTGDRVLRWNRTRPHDADHFAQLVGDTPPGTPSELVFSRRGSAARHIQIITEPRVTMNLTADMHPALWWRGLRLESHRPSDGPAGAGVIVADAPPPRDPSVARLQPGHVIVAINGARVSNLRDFDNRIRQDVEQLELTVEPVGRISIPR